MRSRGPAPRGMKSRPGSHSNPGPVPQLPRGQANHLPCICTEGLNKQGTASVMLLPTAAVHSETQGQSLSRLDFKTGKKKNLENKVEMRKRLGT